MVSPVVSVISSESFHCQFPYRRCLRSSTSVVRFSVITILSNPDCTVLPLLPFGPVCITGIVLVFDLNNESLTFEDTEIPGPSIISYLHLTIFCRPQDSCHGLTSRLRDKFP